MKPIFETMGTILAWGFLILGIFYVILGVDDLFIDLVAWFKRLVPKELRSRQLIEMARLPQRRIAIIIPAWDEGDIIERMLLGNMTRIEYQNFDIFVGCYPNDPPTIAAVRRVSDRFPKVHAVVNFKDGPTSKGQILNWVVDHVLDYERRNQCRFHAFLMQDSEDLIHRKTLQLVNRELKDADYIQIPVFSLELGSRHLVAGVYMDEFAESHTKDMLVRDYLGGCVPSAGVGTAMSRSMILKIRRTHDGQVLRDGCLTEDYELGVLAGTEGFEQRFAAYWYRDSVSGEKDFIATREYFPKAFSRSIRQKTRWTLGIALQGWRQIGWRGDLTQRYFELRDRKGLFTHPLMLIGYAWALAFIGFRLLGGEIEPIVSGGLFVGLAIFTTMLAINRMVQRTVCVWRVYGVKACICIPFRWPIANLINALAVFNAYYKDVKSRLTAKPTAWSKTAHELPSEFGVVAQLNGSSINDGGVTS